MNRLGIVAVAGLILAVPCAALAQIPGGGGTGGGGGAVASVFGRTGAVTAQSGDYTAAQVGGLSIANNGSDIASPATFISNIGAIPSSTLGQPNGPAVLDGSGSLSANTVKATGASVARTEAVHAADWVNAADQGVVTGASDQTAAFGTAASAIAAFGAVSQVLIPTGSYTISSVVNTLGRNPTWIVPADASLNGFNLASDGGATVRPRRVNAWTFGTYDNAAAMSIIANPSYDQPAQVMGIGTPSASASYASRDSVALYTSNNAPPAFLVSSATFTTTTMVPSSDVNVAALRTGMFIDTPNSISATKYTGQITSWALDGSLITVSGWFQQGNTAAGQTPASGAAVINPISNATVQNSVCFLNSNSYSTRCIGYEMDQSNNEAAYVHNENPALDVPDMRGFYANCSGTYGCGSGFLSVGAAYYGFVSRDNVAGGFVVVNGGTRNPSSCGFCFNAPGGTPFAAYDSSTSQTYFSVSGTSGNVHLGQGNNVATTIDFYTSGPATRDARLQSGVGAFLIRANTIQLNDAGGDIGMVINGVNSAVNYISVAPATTTNIPTFAATSGTDANVSWSLGAKGTGSLKLGVSTNAVGFYGSAGITKATLTGACAGNTGCQALAAELANLGLITNSITN